jgi:hypothetical protein
MWWWIGIGAIAWVAISIVVAVIVARVISHADLEDEAETLRRNERRQFMRNPFRRG